MEESVVHPNFLPLTTFLVVLLALTGVIYFQQSHQDQPQHRIDDRPAPSDAAAESRPTGSPSPLVSIPAPQAEIAMPTLVAQDSNRDTLPPPSGQDAPSPQLPIG